MPVKSIKNIMEIVDLEVLGQMQIALEPEEQCISKYYQTPPTLSLEQDLYEDPFGSGLQISMPQLWIDPTTPGAVKYGRCPVVTDVLIVFRTLATFFGQ